MYRFFFNEYIKTASQTAATLYGVVRGCELVTTLVASGESERIQMCASERVCVLNLKI